MIRWIYSFLLAIVSPVFLYSLYKRKPGKPRFGVRWKEHWGITPSFNDSRPIWIHAVSVGETIAAIPIIKAIKQQKPNQTIVVTTTTSTGAAEVEKLGPLVSHRYMPLDFSWCINRFIKAIKPSSLLIIETELWPNTLHCTQKHGIPITVVNARLSEKSCKRYQQIHMLFRLLIKPVTTILCQYSSDAQRFISLGVETSKVHVTGSVKFDIDVSSTTVEQGSALKAFLGEERPIWIAASTHSGEDEICLSAHRTLLKHYPDALLILVPRHPERFDKVAELCIKEGFSLHRRTQCNKDNESTQVYLGDTMGEMMTLLHAADICFMGGSLLGDKVGGHNLLEPAALRKPLLNGPSYFNFSEVTQLLLDNNAVDICEDDDAIAIHLLSLFNTPQLIEEKGNNALRVVNENRGAIEKTLAQLSI